MTIFQSIIYGLVQGLTEFLPISSSAHLVLLPWFTGWQDPGLAFDVAIHVGTLTAVLIYFRRDIQSCFHWTAENKLPWQIVLATLPGAAAGFLLKGHAETYFRSPLLISGTLSLFAVLLYISDKKKQGTGSLDTLSWGQSFLIGLAQAMAIVPGVSRSGVTITMALFLGLNRSSAVRFSFLLSAPIIFGAGILEAGIFAENISNAVFWVGIITAALSGYAAIAFLMNLVKTRSFTPFVVYRVALSLLILVLALT